MEGGASPQPPPRAEGPGYSARLLISSKRDRLGPGLEGAAASRLGAMLWGGPDKAAENLTINAKLAPKQQPAHAGPKP